MSEANGATSPAGDHHPGEILHVDHGDGRQWVRSATEVPQSIAWVNLEGEWRPVVRVEMMGSADRREIVKYGKGGEFLESTILSPPPSRPLAESPPQPTPQADEV